MGNFKGLFGLGRHLVAAAGLLAVLAATTNAYSIVMRGGKRVEVPAQFSVTSTTLTYETAPGFWITLQMAAIDIPATEQANNEPPGSLLGRATKQKEPPRKSERISVVQESKASRSVTNRDLESFKRHRLESELAYEQRLKDQGLPTLAELRAQAAADAERFWQELVRKRAEAEANERAAQLQAQFAVLNAHLNHLQARIGDLSSPLPGAFTVFDGFPFFGSFGHSRVNPTLFHTPFGLPIGGAFGSFNAGFGFPTHFRGHRRNIFVAPGTHIRGRVHFGGRPHGRPRH